MWGCVRGNHNTTLAGVSLCLLAARLKERKKRGGKEDLDGKDLEIKGSLSHLTRTGDMTKETE